MHLIAQICALSSLLTAVTLAINCPKGTYKSKDKCQSCPSTSFSDKENVPRCQRCRICVSGKFQQERECTAVSNAKCSCIQGYMCSNDACTQCKAHQPCPRGKSFIKEGNSNSDTQCSDCEEGSFSSTEWEPCTKWTDCSDKGMFVIRSGSSSEDRVCGPVSPSAIQIATTTTATATTKLSVPSIFPVRKTSQGPVTQRGHPENPVNRAADDWHVMEFLAAFLVPCLFIPFTMFAVIWTRKRHKQIPNNDETPVAQMEEDACSCHYPVKELGEDSTESSDNLLPV